MNLRTQVGIIGAGPAGLVLAHALAYEGIASIVIEARSRAYVEARIRAGVLEHPTAEMLIAYGLGERMEREGLVHEGVNLRFGGTTHRIDFAALTGKWITVYGQHELVKDLIALRLASGGSILSEVKDVALENIERDPAIHFVDAAGNRCTIACDFIAGCDGFHGICRPSIPAGVLTAYDHEFPFAWLGVLAESPPASRELVYTNHERGFALMSMRTPAMSRLYVQCPAHDDVAHWSDNRFWDELELRLGGHDAPALTRGTILQKAITPMRSYVSEPMQYGRLFLAGDAAHIMPATGAKGLNLAVADVRTLGRGFAEFYRSGDAARLERYSARVLRRVWRTERFSAWMTAMFHRYETHDAFERRLQHAELDYVVTSRAAATTLAENYVGLPFEDEPAGQKS